MFPAKMAQTPRKKLACMPAYSKLCLATVYKSDWPLSVGLRIFRREGVYGILGNKVYSGHDRAEKDGHADNQQEVELELLFQALSRPVWR